MTADHLTAEAQAELEATRSIMNKPEGFIEHQLRTAFKDGASIKHIAEVSGHSKKDAETIIRKHYLVSSAAVEKIESRTVAVNRAINGKPDK